MMSEVMKKWIAHLSPNLLMATDAVFDTQLHFNVTEHSKNVFELNGWIKKICAYRLRFQQKLNKQE